MKSIFLSALLFCCLIFPSCLISKDSVDNKNFSNPKTITKIIKKDYKDIILEISSEHNSDLGYLKGRIIYFRLYKDGFVEFDDYPTESKDNKQLDLEKEKELKQFQVNEAEFSKLTNILSNDEYKKLRSKYEKIESSCDALPQVEVNDSKRKIKIVWCDNLITPYNSPEFPKILSELFKETYQIKSDLLGKQAPYL